MKRPIISARGCMVIITFETPEEAAQQVTDLTRFMDMVKWD